MYIPKMFTIFVFVLLLCTRASHAKMKRLAISYLLWKYRRENRLAVLFMSDLSGSVEAWSEFDLVAAEQVSDYAAVPHNI